MARTLPRTRKQLRDALARSLRRKSLPDEVWDELEDYRYIDDYLLKHDQEQFEIVLAQARRMMRKEPGRRQGQRTGQRIEDLLHPLERMRLDVISHYTARVTDRDRRVKRIREHLLGGGIMTIKEAERFLRQVALRYYHPAWFISQGIPIANQTSFFLDPPPAAILNDSEVRSRIRIEWDGGSKEVEFASFFDAMAQSEGVSLSLPNGKIPVTRHSVFGTIQRTAAELARVNEWIEPEATMFILTGETPRLAAIVADMHHINRGDDNVLSLELNIQHWISPATVQRVYKKFQYVELEQQTRMVSEKLLCVFAFVMEYIFDHFNGDDEPEDHEPLDIPWKKLATEWNRELEDQPKLHYSAARLRRDFLRVRWRLLQTMHVARRRHVTWETASKEPRRAFVRRID